MNFIDNLVSHLKKHSPEILVGLGIGGVITGTVLACKETRKIDGILEKHNETVTMIHMASDTGMTIDKETNSSIPYTEEDRKRDLALTYGKTALDLTKLYLPSGLIIVTSLACILQSHKILTNRNLGLTAAYTGLSKVFDEYRKNIIEKYGEDADSEARYSIKAIKARGKKDDPENKIYQETEKTGLNEVDHSRFFDADSRYWDKSPNLNLMAIKSAEKSLNRILFTKRDHTISLNDCYNALDLRNSNDDRVLGYKYRPGIDPVDENGFPQVVRIPIYVMNMKGKRILKTADEILKEGYDESVMLLDFPNLVPIV